MRFGPRPPALPTATFKSVFPASTMDGRAVVALSSTILLIAPIQYYIRHKQRMWFELLIVLAFLLFSVCLLVVSCLQQFANHGRFFQPYLFCLLLVSDLATLCDAARLEPVLDYIHFSPYDILRKVLVAASVGLLLNVLVVFVLGVPSCFTTSPTSFYRILAILSFGLTSALYIILTVMAICTWLKTRYTEGWRLKGYLIGTALACAVQVVSITIIVFKYGLDGLAAEIPRWIILSFRIALPIWLGLLKATRKKDDFQIPGFAEFPRSEAGDGVVLNCGV
ncbi:uncharacterized protein PAC_05594 [Phialocephala subalpina]|uniref:Uncharacterized protein n=1 Tax=Phialocephala subalpina TaxID=576137 RepID=A0A1L7WSG3_9HELO|nr:uncharacterized protein PAC_05594 [Phialocephala subalpina]